MKVRDRVFRKNIKAILLVITRKIKKRTTVLAVLSSGIKKASF